MKETLEGVKHVVAEALEEAYQLKNFNLDRKTTIINNLALCQRALDDSLNQVRLQESNDLQLAKAQAVIQEAEAAKKQEVKQ